MGFEEKIAEIEKEISRTQRNKATEAHLGLLRSRLAKLRLEHGVPKPKPVAKSSAKSSKPGTVKKPKERVTRKQNTSSTESSEEEASTSSSESDLEPETKSAFNKFAALNLDAEDDGSGGEGSEDAAGESVEEKPVIAKNSKKDRKKKKKSVQAVEKVSSDEPSFDKLTEEELLEYYGSQNRQTSSTQSATLRTYTPGLNPKLLNYRYEFQKALGKNAASLLEDASSAGSSRTKPGMVRGIHYLFVTPGQNSMDAKEFIDRYIRVEADPGKPTHMLFKRTKRYKELQHNFLLMVYTNQDQIIQDVLHQMPFHTDALLLMSNIYERDENIASARQVIETALNGLQQCFDHQQRNNPQSHRMSYKYPANRSYFVLLFKHINLIASRFPKTALEIGKYLFNLSPMDDPLAMILVLDHLALKARDYSYLTAFYRTLKDVKNLDMLPNFSYSYPLALFHQASRRDSQPEMDEAKEALRSAILHFPSVLTLLFEKLEIPMGKDLSAASLIRDSQREENAGLDLLQALYVRRSHSLWKEPEVLSFVISTANSLLPTLNTPEMKHQLQQIAENRKRSYQGTPSSVWRHVILLNIPDSERVFQLRTANDTQNFVFPFDPIPPSNSEEKDEYDLRTAFKTNQSARPTPPEVVVPEPGNTETVGNIIHQIINATGDFFHSFLPSTAIPVPGAEEAGSAIFNGEVIMGAPIHDDAPLSGELSSYMDRITIMQDEMASGKLE